MYVQGAIGFGFPSHWLKNLGEFLSVAFAIAKSKSHLNAVLIGISCKPLNSFFNTDLYLKTQEVSF